MNKKLKQIAASLLSVLMIICFMPATGVAFAAETTCHIGDAYFATLQAAVDSAEEGDTIVIDSADAGDAVIDGVVNVDVAKSGYDVKKGISYDDEEICAETEGTVTSFALHGVPAADGGVIFNWDTSAVPATATVTFKDANGHTSKDVEADVDYEPEDLSALCESDLEVTYTAEYLADDGEEYTEKKTITIPQTGHIYALNDDGQSAWWDGKTYNSKGIPTLKNVKVSCINGEKCGVMDKDAKVEFVEAIPSTTNAPTCTEPGEVTYTFKVLYDGNHVKDVYAEKEADRSKDVLISIVDESAPATGVHVHDDAIEPGIEFKAYKTKEVEGKTVFVSAKDETKTVTDKAAAAVEWVEDADSSAYAQGYDDVLTYRIVYTCNKCHADFSEEDVEAAPKSTVTKFYLANDEEQVKDGKSITAANDCTAYSVETGTFDAVKVIYAQGEYGAQKVKDFEIGNISKPAKTDYEPQHNSTGQEVDVVTPTHTTKGSKEFDCADCGQHVIVELPTVGEHKFKKDSKTVVDPTCEEIGYTYQICETCEEAGLAPVGEDGKEVKDLPTSFTVPGAIVSATTPALGHNYVVLNADKDVEWDESFVKDEDGKYFTHCIVDYECAQCREKLEGVNYYSEEGKDDADNKYSAISNKVTKAKDCTENDTITFTVDGIKDYNTGKGLAKDYKDTEIIGNHEYKVKTANFSADGKSVNVNIECAKADKCKGEKARTISATSTASDVDAATGLTTYTASITEKNLKSAGIDAKEIDTTIPAEAATKKLYDLTKAEVTVPNYTDLTYAEKEDKDVVVKIGNATIDPKFYTINWPEELEAPELKATLTVSATDVEDKGVTATGTSKKAQFEVTETLDEPEDAVKVMVDGEDAKGETEFEYTYDGKNKTLVASTKTKGAKVSYIVDGEEADKVELKDVKFNKRGNVTYYEVQYVIRYTEGGIYTSDVFKFTIKPAAVKIIKPAYDKLEGQDDPAIEYNASQAAEGDDLKLSFEKHSETPGTYKLEVECNNTNYVIEYPTAEWYLTLTIKSDESVKEDATTAQKAADEITEANGYDAESVKAVADAKAKLDEAVRSGDTANMKDATKALNEAMDAAKAKKAEAEEAKAKEEANAAADKAAKAAAGVTTKVGYAAADVAAVKKAADALAAAKAKSGATAAEIQAATKALNAAIATADNNGKKAPAKVKLNKKKTKSAKKGKITVVWKKVKGVKGYQIKVGKKSYNVKSAKIAKKIVKAKAGKKFAVKVRAYKVFKGKKIYGKWSAAKKVKVKK